MSTTASDVVFAGRDPDRYPVKRMRINTIAEETADAGVTLYSSMLAKDSGLKVDAILGPGSTPVAVNLNGATMHYNGTAHYGAIGVTSSLAATPTPASGVATIWQADGTTNVDGDFMTTVHNGSTTATNVLAPASRYQQGTYTTITDINYNGTSNVLISGCTLTLKPGTYIVGYKISLFANGTKSSIVSLIKNPSGTPADTAGSLSKSRGSTNTRRSLAKMFPLTVAAETEYQLAFRSDGVGSGVGVDMAIGTGEADPDTVPTVWAVQVA